MTTYGFATKNRIATGLVMGIFMVSMAGMANASLITNGDFQTGDLTGWNFSSNVAVTTGGGGNSVARFNVPAPSGDARLYQNFDVDPNVSGVRVEFDFRFVSDTGSTDDFFRSFLRLETDLGGTPDEIANINIRRNTTTGFDHVTAYIPFAGLSIDPPPSNARIVFVLRENVGDSSRAVLDNVEVHAIPEATSILVWGLLGGCVFYGTAAKRRR